MTSLNICLIIDASEIQFWRAIRANWDEKIYTIQHSLAQLRRLGD